MVDIARLSGLVTLSDARARACERCDTMHDQCLCLSVEPDKTPKWTCPNCFNSFAEAVKLQAFYAYVCKEDNEVIFNAGGAFVVVTSYEQMQFDTGGQVAPDHVDQHTLH